MNDIEKLVMASEIALRELRDLRSRVDEGAISLLEEALKPYSKPGNPGWKVKRYLPPRHPGRKL